MGCRYLFSVVDLTQTEGVPVARITTAQLHMYFIPELKERLFAAVAKEPENLIVDLTQVEYLDSSAMGVLFQLQKKMQSYGSSLYLIGINPTIALVFKLTKSDQHFEICTTIQEAIKKISTR